MLDVITFGSASWDIFVKPKSFEIVKGKNFISGEGVAFNLGSKVDLKEVYFNSGGGGTNTAATFAKQGLKTAYCGAVGEDAAGKEIIEELNKLNIETKFLVVKKYLRTNHSIVLSSGKKRDRTILVYRGASEFLENKDISWDKIKLEKPKWIYLAPLSGQLAKLTEKIVSFAYENKIKIAVNPGNSQILMPGKKIEKIIKKADVLFLNQEESSLLAKINFKERDKIFEKINKMFPGIFAMTMGEEGVIVSDKKNTYWGKTKKIKVVDNTGAGDAFASGFISGLIKNCDLKEAISFGLENAESCLKKIGAKKGLIEKTEKDEIKKRKIVKI